MIKISNIEKKMTGNSVILSCLIENKKNKKKLWYEIKGLNFENINAVNYNWAIVAILLPAMMAEQDIYVEGSLSKKLCANLNGDLQDIFLKFEPTLRKIKISSAKFESSKKTLAKRVATGFSAGIDSFATLAINQYGQSEATEITDLVTFNCGAMGQAQNTEVKALFNIYKKRTDKFAHKNKLNSISIESNLDTFYKFPLGFQKTHTLRNISLAMLLDGYISKYLYSSGYDFSKTSIRKYDDSAILDPIILPLLSTEKISFISAGASLTRFEKTKLVSRMLESHLLLDVCTAPAVIRANSGSMNCSKCYKCERTLVTLDLLNQEDNYLNVFDLDYFKTHRLYYYSGVLLRSYLGSSFDKEIVDNFNLSKINIFKIYLHVPLHLFNNFIFYIKLMIKEINFFKKIVSFFYASIPTDN
jgi:hypothetical protein